MADGPEAAAADVELGLKSAATDEQLNKTAADGQQQEEKHSSEMTIGGVHGHIMRRIYHVIMFVSLPILYYALGEELEDAIGFRRERLLAVIALLMVVVEVVRLHFGIVFFGLRSYERHSVSAQAWGTVGSMLVLLLAPTRGFVYPTRVGSFEQQAWLGFPILASLGIIDPLMGELKVRTKWPLRKRLAVGTVAAAAIWFVSAAWLASGSALAWVLPFIMGPITVAAEYPSIPSIDDNGVMCLVPLAVVTLLNTFNDNTFV